MRLFAVAAPGLEPVVAQELANLPGVSELRQVPGGVEFAGDEALLYRANVELRCATRVLLRVAEFAARDFAALKRGLAAVPWRQYAGAATPVTVRAAAHRSRLYHTGAIADRVLETLAERGLAEGATVASAGTGEEVPGGGLGVFLRAESDRFTVSIDTSGELLHRRGWRTEGGEAPLRETLAAALLRLADWKGKTPLCDPTCGSGTIAIEAALLACGRAPGLGRRFAFQSWPGYRAERFQSLCQSLAAAERRPPPGFIFASDISPAAVEISRRNAERAGVADLIRFTCADVAASHLPPPELCPPGLVLCNPPYGKRIGDELRRLYRALGRFSRSAPGWRLALLCPSTGPGPGLAQAAERRLTALRLHNGGLRVALFMRMSMAMGSKLAEQEGYDYAETQGSRGGP